MNLPSRTARAGLTHDGMSTKAPPRGLPMHWRDRLPHPSVYYAAHVAQLGRVNGEGWAQGLCPFHDDHHASLSVHLDSVRGGWRCFACGEHGDLIAFHMRTTGLGFVEAVRALVRGAS
jgi:hypothetical protein